MAQKLISPPDLFTLLSESPTSNTIVFDIRGKEKFSKERIWSSIHLDLEKFNTILGISKDVYRMGEKTTAISPPYAAMFNNWDMYDIVVVDEDGSDKKSICSQFKHQTCLTNATRLLVGGYNMFSMLYPSLCENSPSQDIFLINKCQKELMAHGPTEVLPHLFIGDKDTAQNFKAIDMLGIEYMINVSGMLPNYAPQAYRYMRCDLEELPFGDLLPMFTETAEFIGRAKSKNSKVLIYSDKNGDCLAGMVACAYILKSTPCSMESSFITFKKVFPSFAPSVVLLSRLGEYEQSLFGATYIESTPLPQLNKSFLVSDELKYVRRQQIYKHEEEGGEDDGTLDDEENLC